MVVDISLVFFLSIFILDLISEVVFLFSVKLFSLSTLSTFSAELVVGEFELGSSTVDLLFSIVFSLINSLLLFSILLLPLSIFVLDLKFKETFLYSSLSTLSTISAELLVAESELVSSTDDLIFSVVFSLINSLLLVSILFLSLSRFALVLTFKETFLSSFLSTLSTFSAELLLDLFELGSSTDDLPFSVVFSLIILMFEF